MQRATISKVRPVLYEAVPLRIKYGNSPITLLRVSVVNVIMTYTADPVTLLLELHVAHRIRRLF